MIYNSLSLEDKLSILTLVKENTDNKIDSLLLHEHWEIIRNTPFLVDYLIKKDNFNYFSLLGDSCFHYENIALAIIKHTKSIEYIPEKLLNNIEFIKNIFIHIPSANNIIPEQYWQKNELIEELIILYEKKELLSVLPEDLIKNQQFIRYIINNKPEYYPYLPHIFKNDISLFNSYLNNNNIYERYLSAGEEIKSNIEISKQVIIQAPKAYSYCGETLKIDENFFITLIKNNVDCLEFASKAIQDNELCVWESVKVFPTSLQYASERLLNLPSYCLQVSNNMTLEDFHITFPIWSEHVRDSKEIIDNFISTISINNDLQHIGSHILNDYDFILNILSFDRNIIHYVGPDVASNSNFFIEGHKLINLQEKRVGEYDLTNPQSEIFKAITSEATDDIYFLLDLHNHFSNIFINIIYPYIKHFKNDTINYLNNEITNGSSIEKIMHGYNLDKRIKNKLSNKTNSKKI